MHSLVLTLLFAAAEPPEIPLWPQGAPGSEAKPAPEAVRVTNDGEHVVSGVHKPSLTLYRPAPGAATGVGVVIAPGGGHRELWMDHEGHNLAHFLAARGVAALVLKYRLAREKDSSYTIEGHAFADAQRALRLARHRAGEWRIDPAKLGILGFSAGGELAALAAVHDGAGVPDAADPIDRISARPAFHVLVYPAIPKSMPVTRDTPPGFYVCGENDRQNISQGLPELYLAMRRAGASAELHVFAGIGHGFGVRARTRGPAAGWPARLAEWLQR
ncbi:MAG: alpha/beta hydrolase [Acidobacteria bacterium]|nr:alpha/beta hydrolase [Acidobacteriota bacterium]